MLSLQGLQQSHAKIITLVLCVPVSIGHCGLNSAGSQCSIKKSNTGFRQNPRPRDLSTLPSFLPLGFWDQFMALVGCSTSLLGPDANAVNSTVWKFDVCCNRGDGAHHKYAKVFYQSKVTDLFPPFPSEFIRSYKGETTRQIPEACLYQKSKG